MTSSCMHQTLGCLKLRFPPWHFLFAVGSFLDMFDLQQANPLSMAMGYLLGQPEYTITGKMKINISKRVFLAHRNIIVLILFTIFICLCFFTNWNSIRFIVFADIQCISVQYLIESIVSLPVFATVSARVEGILVSRRACTCICKNWKTDFIPSLS